MLLPQLLALRLHRDGDLYPAAFDTLDEIAQNTMDRLTNLGASASPNVA